MIRIVCCDDNIIHLNMLKQELAALVVGERVDAVYFCCCGQMIEYMERYGETVDVLLCDTVLGQQNAIGIVGELKKRHANVQVIFMSVLAALCEQTYSVEHVYFLNKPVRRDALVNAVLLAIRQAKCGRQQHLNIQSRGSIKTIELSRILYIESALREIRIVAEDQCVLAYNRMSDMTRRLDDRFVCCHKSYIVNLEKVERMGRLQFVLTDGQTVPVSQGRFQKTKEQYLQYTGQLPSLDG
ncbi:MAG: LytR/AlgR family response regulator transcription factor [Acetanaerobacterium sp.]